MREFSGSGLFTAYKSTLFCLGYCKDKHLKGCSQYVPGLQIFFKIGGPK